MIQLNCLYTEINLFNPIGNTTVPKQSESIGSSIGKYQNYYLEKIILKIQIPSYSTPEKVNMNAKKDK